MLSVCLSVYQGRAGRHDWLFCVSTTTEWIRKQHCSRWIADIYDIVWFDLIDWFDAIWFTSFIHFIYSLIHCFIDWIDSFIDWFFEWVSNSLTHRSINWLMSSINRFFETWYLVIFENYWFKMLQKRLAPVNFSQLLMTAVFVICWIFKMQCIHNDLIGRVTCRRKYIRWEHISRLPRNVCRWAI